MLQYHHCRSLDSVVYGNIAGSPEYAGEDFIDAYSWLEKEVGFYPTFLAVGSTEEDIRMTGYQNQWGRIVSEGFEKKRYRKKGEFPNNVLFSFEDVEGVFMDYGDWHRALSADHKNHEMTAYEKRLIFKPSWPKSKWLRKAKNDPHSVQLVTPELYLPGAARISVRNQKTKKLLMSRGFDNIETKRIPFERPKCN